MLRRLVICLILIFITKFAAFGQTSALRDYVGMISQKFHTDVISFLEDLREDFEKRGHSDAAKSVDVYLKGESGTGFVYVADGKNYILTNYHVISQANSLSVSFEKTDGEKTVFSDLTIIAADEESYYISSLETSSHGILVLPKVIQMQEKTKLSVKENHIKL